MYLSIIFPAFNEEGIIEEHVNQVAAYLENLLPGDKPFEIVMVDDGSSDATPGIMDRMAGENPQLRAVHHPRNLGRGRAIRTGFENAQGQYVVSLDADLSYAPKHIERLLAPLESGEADVVLASAYHSEGSVRNVPFKRAFISRVANMILARSFPGGLHTVTCVVRGYRREVTDTLELISDGKDFHLEILQKAMLLGFRVAEIPAHLKWRPAKRTSGGGKGLSLGKLARMTCNHLFANFLFRPNLLLYLPAALTVAIMLAILGNVGWAFADLLAQQPQDIALSSQVFAALRKVILQAKVSFFLLGFCVLFLLQFGALTLLANQQKHGKDEQYILTCRTNARLRKLLGERE
ncbi:glycosyltransferase family 2 protein [Desulfohalovibrio reitneri]|uniref:glycosyltransferase family 2 protein n=1 Tax=Desulfohalovibrio reitneri TaxID=1307759 RepID=UPI0006903D88|nr:glycosyltransferase family 2 protein [Desulfohalovibrio reitneri]